MCLHRGPVILCNFGLLLGTWGWGWWVEFPCGWGSLWASCWSGGRWRLTEAGCKEERQVRWQEIDRDWGGGGGGGGLLSWSSSLN